MATYLKFTLSMPSNNSWNGQWTGAGNDYYVIKSFKKNSNIPIKCLKEEYFSYNFGDGWKAGITVTEIDANLAAKLKRRKHSFCGYEWMVDSIIKHNQIIDEPKV